MNQLKVFENEEFGKVRTMVDNGEPMFCLADICRPLGITNCRMVSERLDEDERRKLDLPRQGATWFVNESGLYAVVLRSDKPNAKKFRKWVTSDVLPAIRNTGTYSQKPLTTPEQIKLLAQGNIELSERIDNVEQDLEDFKQELPLLGCDMDRITTAVHTMGVKCLGGKKSNAYADKSIRSKVYADIYDQLKRQFGVTTYK
ncbi:MAG: BRO family protein, partial [Clostridiales bacterium]|nr:BRO family protein [Clostridiales bacterium]